MRNRFNPRTQAAAVKTALLGGMVLSLALGACRQPIAATASQSTAPPPRYDVVPAEQPTGTDPRIWAELSADSNVLHHPRGSDVDFIWNLMCVQFKPSVSREEKQRLLDSLHAVVIGGVRIGAAHYYHIKLNVPRPASRDSSAALIFRVRSVLLRHPDVERVTLDWMGDVTPAALRSDDTTRDGDRRHPPKALR